MLGVSALLATTVALSLDQDLNGNGGQLFRYLHMTLFFTILILVPLMTADTLSRERREGTLGLLFLTGLRPVDLVLSKGMANGLRATTLWLAVLPVLTIPVLLGGMSWQEGLLSVAFNFSALCGGLAAGFLASAFCRVWLRSILLAGLISGCLVYCSATAVSALVSNSLTGRPGVGILPATSLFWGIRIMLNELGDWAVYVQMITASQLVRMVAALMLGSLFCLLVALWLAGFLTRRHWREEPLSTRRAWVEKSLFTPIIAVDLLRRWMKWYLLKNPVGWLEQRTWSGRLVLWGWTAVVVCIYTGAFNDPRLFGALEGLHLMVAWLLAGSAALCAVGSFRRERETGVLELLLVSPLGERALVWGRLRGLLGQFLPSACFFLSVWAYLRHVFPFSHETSGRFAPWFFVAAFVGLPVVGLYFSLRCRNYILGFLATLVIGLFIPLVGASLLVWVFSDDLVTGWRVELSWPAACLVCLTAWLCWLRLLNRLKRRTFRLERTL
jgi:ABC-type Na+ efflux pump permease subunit